MEVKKYLGNGIDEVEREIVLKNDNKFLRVLFAGNLDLYFIFHSITDNYFEITKENYYIYECFLNLYNSIKNNKIFEVDEFDLRDCRTIEDIDCIYEEKEKLNEYYKTFYNYDELFHDGIITWKSDDSSDTRSAGTVSIIKEDDSFRLNFSDTYTSVRFRNRASYYQPYNLLFMDLFNKLMKYDEEDKQIHVEEYLYNEKKRVKR